MSASAGHDSGPSRVDGLRPPRGRLTLAVLAVAFGFGVVLFAALGAWQVLRLGWKLELIERIDARIHAAPVAPPPPAEWSSISASGHEYLRVQLHGHWLPGKSARALAVTEAGSGHWLITPLRQDDGTIVLVNRGLVPGGWTPPEGDPPIEAPVAVTGLLRITEPGGGFLRENAPDADRWFSRDVAAIAASRGLTRVAPYFVDAERGTADAPEWPRGGLTVVSFRNNHLGYALTWFVLALLVAGGGWRFAIEERRIRRRWRERGLESANEHSTDASRPAL